MIYIRQLGAAPDDIEKAFDVALFETHVLTLAFEALRECRSSGARRTHHNDATTQWSYLVELVFSICLRRE
jgi:hypothetical protein